MLVSGNCVVHQFVRIGRLAMMRGMSRTSRDIPPFCIADLTHTLRGINAVGLRRAAFEARSITALRHAFKTLFGERRNLKLAIEELAAAGPLTPEVAEMVEFIRAARRGVAFGPRAAGEADHSDDCGIANRIAAPGRAYSRNVANTPIWSEGQSHVPSGSRCGRSANGPTFLTSASFPPAARIIR